MSEYFRDITDNLMGKIDVSDLLEYFKVNVDEGFNVPIGYYTDFYNNYGSKSSVSINKDTVIGMGSMKYLDTDKKVKITNIIFCNSGRYPTTMSKEFFEINPLIFQNITKEFLRDKKINKILNK
jgi:hypothetical protein